MDVDVPAQETTAIENAEGFRSHAYWDGIGRVWTVGFGQTGPDIGPNTVVTRQEATQWLIGDETALTSQLFAALPWAVNLSSVRVGALVDAAYNLGLNGLLQFATALSAMKAANWKKAVSGFRASLWYSQVPDRVNTICYMVLLNEWAEEYLTPEQMTALETAMNG